MKVLYVDYVISLSRATRIIRFLKAKKHQNFQYFFELEELPCYLSQRTQIAKHVPNFSESMLYGFYPMHSANCKSRHDTAFRLKVYREILDK